MENWVQKIESYKDHPEGSFEKREYDAFKLPERDFALKYYGSAQEGSSERKLYDYYTLPLQEYIARYFADPDLTRWNNWYHKFVVPAFVPSARAGYVANLKVMRAPFIPDFEKLEEAFLKLSREPRMDEELQRFFAFAESIGVFTEQHTTPEKWLNDSNWENKSGSSGNAAVSVNQILSFPFGTAYLKCLLIDVLIKAR